MLCYLFIKNHMPILPQRTLNFVMNILHYCRKVRLSI